MGAEYLKSHIIGKLAGARNHLNQSGRWAGEPLSAGYMVDTRKELESGPTPHHRRIFPFDPFAQVVQEYYRLFVEYSGSLTKTHRHIWQHQVYFPDPNVIKPPKGSKTPYHNLKLRDGGYYPSREGLRAILSNPVYIGHWMVENTVVVWNNHEGIVPESLFWQAFNYLVTL